jgi:uncharacterized protein YeaO (DUF488 family)
MRRDALAIDAWYRELAPSTDLRRWFNHDAALWDEFQERYREELQSDRQARKELGELATRAREGTVTLVFGARDEEHNNAVALAGFIRQALEGAGAQAGR